MATFMSYPCTLTHELLDGPLEADVPASCPERAANRLRLTAMHMYHCAELLIADVEVGTPRPLG